MTTLTLTDVLQASFRTSRAADNINEELRTVLGLPHRYGPARLAIARSLSLAEQPSLEPVAADEPGRVIKGDQLFGTEADLGTWTALIVERGGRPLSKKEMQELVGAHWHRGALLLWQDWELSEQDYARFVRRVCEEAGLGSDPSDKTDDAGMVGGEPTRFAAQPIRLKLGDPGIDIATNQPLIWTLNAPGVSPHIAAMGTLGTGKTRTAMNLLGQIKHQQSGCAFVVFDFKGDLAESSALVDALQAKVVRPPSVPVPVDVLAPGAKDDQSVNEAAFRFRESFARVAQSRPGGIQLDALRDAARSAIGRGGVVRIEHVRNALAEIYEELQRKPDTMTATFNDLCTFHLFEPQLLPAQFLEQSWIVDLHAAPETAQRFVAFLMFDAIDAWLKRQKDASLDAGNHRALRLVLAIDEARRVLGYGQPSLIEIVRMSRSKGGAVVLVSQSPDDFVQEREDFLENIGLTFSFRTNAEPGSLRRVFGERVDLAGLPNGVCVTRLPDPSRRHPIRVQAWV